MHALREKVLAVKLMVIDLNSTGATQTAKSGETCRSALRSSVVVCDRKQSRVRSVRQNLAKADDML